MMAFERFFSVVIVARSLEENWREQKQKQMLRRDRAQLAESSSRMDVTTGLWHPVLYWNTVALKRQGWRHIASPKTKPNAKGYTDSGSATEASIATK